MSMVARWDLSPLANNLSPVPVAPLHRRCSQTLLAFPCSFPHQISRALLFPFPYSQQYTAWHNVKCTRTHA